MAPEPEGLEDWAGGVGVTVPATIGAGFFGVHKDALLYHDHLCSLNWTLTVSDALLEVSEEW